MSLSDDLKDPSHPVTRLIHTSVPRREEWISRVQATAAAAPHEVPARSPGRRALGYAFEFCVGIDLVAERPYERLLDLLPPSHAAWVLDRPIGSASDLVKRGYYLGFFQDLLFKNGREARPFLDQFRHPLDAIPHFEQSKGELERLWLLYERGPRSRLRAADTVHLSLVVHGDQASSRPHRTADLLVDSTLVEIKTGYPYQDQDELDRTLCQTLVYAALAQHRGLKIESVALYLARVGLLLEWSLSELLPQLAAEPVDLASLGSALAAATDARRER